MCLPGVLYAYARGYAERGADGRYYGDDDLEYYLPGVACYLAHGVCLFFGL